MNINREYMRLCYDLAAKSPDPSNQNGAIIIDIFGNVLTQGINEIVPGTNWTPEKLQDRDWKLFHIEHAERNAIWPLIPLGISSKEYSLTMICPWFSCSDCSKAILLSGIKKVIGHQERMDTTPDRWKTSVEAGLNMLRNGGVQLEFWSGKVDGDPIIVNGELWYP